MLLLLTGLVATARSGQEEQAAYVPGEERKSAKCGGGDPCVFVNRDAQWVEYIPTNDPRNSHKPKPVPPQPGSFEGEDVPILISISSFRDKLCPVTLFNIFSKAQHRDRIAVQVVQQNDNALDKDCFDEYCKLMQAKYGNGSGGDTSAYVCPYADNIHVSAGGAGACRSVVSVSVSLSLCLSVSLSLGASIPPLLTLKRTLTLSLSLSRHRYYRYYASVQRRRRGPSGLGA